MAVNVEAAPNARRARRAAGRRRARGESDFAIFAAMTPEEAAQWVDDNCTADAATKVILKLLMRSFTSIAEDL